MAAFQAGFFGKFRDRKFRKGDAARLRDEFWPKMKSVAANIPFAEDAVAAYYCTLDRGTPLRVRGMLMGALAYFVMPADVLPDFLPALGFTDDAAVLMATFQLISSHIKPEHREAAKAALSDIQTSG
ncbi:MAG TPA: YkvA family protein [Xanthobacteraceae bacterium]|nr:YkvA family protein [Xanthobacteraceae bacterium]